MRLPHPSRRRGLALAAAVLAATTAGTALAVTAWAPGPNGIVNACRNTSTGVLRLLSGTATACKTGEQRVSWERYGNLRSGAGAPAAALGIKGDFYYDTAAHQLYGPKTSAWGSPVSIGAPGTAGRDGNTVLSGTGAPAAGTGTDGDFWLDTATMTMYGPRAAGAWPGAGTALTGPKGDTGATGDTGPAGADGRTVLSGSGAPAADLGADGDLYLDTTAHALYGPKSAGAWGSATSLVGPAGATGDTGATGAAGANALALAKPGFTRTTVDSIGTVGYFAAATTGADGLVLIAYYDATNGDLKVAHCTDMACTSASTASLDIVGDVGQHASIAIGADGLGLISYYGNQANGSLRVAHCNNTACSSATISLIDPAGYSGQYTSTAVGIDGLGLISYYSSLSGSLKVAHCSNTACTSATTSTLDIGAGRFTSIAIGADGLGLISHVNPNTGKLKVSHCTDIACTTATAAAGLDTTSGVGYYTSITIGADGRGLVSYPGGAGDQLKVAHCTDIACTAVTATVLAAASGAGQESAISLGRDGLGIIAYFDPTTGDLRTAHCTNTDCSAAVVNTVDNTTTTTGVNPSVAIGMDGLPVIAYCDYTNGDLKVVHLPSRLGSPFLR